MWIEISNDIVEGACKNDDPMSKEVCIINDLIDSMFKGKHIVFLRKVMIDKLIKWDNLSPTNKKYLGLINQRYTTIYSVRDRIKYKIVVSKTSGDISLRDKVYDVPLEYLEDVRETKFLTENESDGIFFEGICKLIMEIEKMNAVYNIKFENDSGHGSNVVSKMKGIASDKRIAICILDTDKEMECSAVGSTYKGASNCLKKIRKNTIIHLEALKSREKENLIPPSVYKLFCKEREELLVVLEKFEDKEKIIRYFDIKEGINYKKYKIEGWIDYYKEVIGMLKESGIYNLPDEKSGDNFVCIEGIGEKWCDIVQKVILGPEEDCKKKLSEIGVLDEDKIKYIRNEIRREKNRVLPIYIYNEWKDIYKWLFDWCCCIDKKAFWSYVKI